MIENDSLASRSINKHQYYRTFQSVDLHQLYMTKCTMTHRNISIYPFHLYIPVCHSALCHIQLMKVHGPKRSVLLMFVYAAKESFSIMMRYTTFLLW